MFSKEINIFLWNPPHFCSVFENQGARKSYFENSDFSSIYIIQEVIGPINIKKLSIWLAFLLLETKVMGE